MKIPDSYADGFFETTDSGLASYLECVAGVQCELQMDAQHPICTFRFADEDGQIGWLAMEYNVRDIDPNKLAGAVSAKQFYSHVRGLWKRISSLKAQRRGR